MFGKKPILSQKQKEMAKKEERLKKMAPPQPRKRNDRLDNQDSSQNIVTAETKLRLSMGAEWIAYALLLFGVTTLALILVHMAHRVDEQTCVVLRHLADIPLSAPAKFVWSSWQSACNDSDDAPPHVRVRIGRLMDGQPFLDHYRLAPYDPIMVENCGCAVCQLKPKSPVDQSYMVATVFGGSAEGCVACEKGRDPKVLRMESDIFKQRICPRGGWAAAKDDDHKRQCFAIGRRPKNYSGDLSSDAEEHCDLHAAASYKPLARNYIVHGRRAVFKTAADVSFVHGWLKRNTKRGERYEIGLTYIDEEYYWIDGSEVDMDEVFGEHKIRDGPSAGGCTNGVHMALETGDGKEIILWKTDGPFRNNFISGVVCSAPLLNSSAEYQFPSCQPRDPRGGLTPRRGEPSLCTTCFHRPYCGQKEGCHDNIDKCLQHFEQHFSISSSDGQDTTVGNSSVFQCPLLPTASSTEQLEWLVNTADGEPHEIVKQMKEVCWEEVH